MHSCVYLFYGNMIPHIVGWFQKEYNMNERLHMKHLQIYVLKFQELVFNIFYYEYKISVDLH